MLTLCLVDTELEIIPPPIRGHAQVVTSAQRVGTSPGRMLLDSSLHYAAMRRLEDGDRRGRPDLVHVFLLHCLESLLNKRGDLRVLIHTREGRLMRVDPTTRIVRNFNRFCGLIQQLFETGKVPPDKPLLTMTEGWTVRDLVAEQKPDRVIILDETGRATAPWDVFGPGDANRHTLALIGGFPSGTFRSELPEAERLSFGREQLTVWTVAAELVTNYERATAVESSNR